MRKLISIFIIFLVLLYILLSPTTASLRSYAVIYPYSRILERKSTLNKNKIVFKIPGGRLTKKHDWYPFVVLFNDDEGMSSYLGEEVEFTVLFNFAAFEKGKGSSSYYNPESPYYSGFYGGYIIKPKADKIFGFKSDGSIDEEEISKVPRYDQLRLVLPSIGCPYKDRVFDEFIKSIEYNVEYLGYKDWVAVDSEIETTSPIHEYGSFHRGYIQYGSPQGRFFHDKDFPKIELKGRVYIRYFEEHDATFVLYIMAPEWKTIDECDREILSHSIIKKKDKN